MTPHEKSLRLTQAISEYIIRNAPVIPYTPEEVRRAERSFTDEEKQVLRDAGWLNDDFECWYVTDRFQRALGIEEQADDDFLRLLYQNARRLEKADLEKDLYLRHIRVPETRLGRFQLKLMTYARGEFLQWDMPDLSARTVVPKLAFFTQPVRFPAVYEGNMPWVSVCPSEINSMGPDVKKAHGHTLVLGLGLGWYPFQISELQQVESVTVIELQSEIIALFEQHILPQFPQRNKIKVIRADAFEYLKDVQPGQYDFCYADIWESQVDGAAAYKKILPHEERLRGTEFAYWIKKEILWQLRNEEE